MNIKFMGAAHTVTGSRTLCHHAGFTLTIDCGLFQGPKRLRELNWKPLNGASSNKAVILTHAHLDHSGLLPVFVKSGFAGPIYCSSATADLVRILLLDAAHLQEEDARFANKTGYSNHKPALPLYTVEDVHRALKQLRPVPQGEWQQLDRDLSFRLSRSGHILGSSFVELSGGNGNGGRTLLFSGDLGNGRSEIIKPPMSGFEADALVLESTYGDRQQPQGAIVSEHLAEIVNRVIARQGVLVIPAFAVGRTQEMLFVLRRLEDEGVIPSVPVVLDSPMAKQATDVFLKYPDEHLTRLKNGALVEAIFPHKFRALDSMEESKALNKTKGPMIIVSAAGMLTGGRIMHHLKNRLPASENALLFVGYQAAETKGRLLQEGGRDLRIHHQQVAVKAEILTLEGISAHADQDDLVAWVRKLRKIPLRIFINHGDLGAPEVLKARLSQEFDSEIIIPTQGEEFHLW